jgi:uncharacterized protein (DUF305 family)
MDPVRSMPMAAILATTIVFALHVGQSRAAEIYKCLDSNGKPLFQGTPCAGSGNKIAVKPANGTVAADTAPEGAPASPVGMTSSKLKASVSALELDRKKREIDYDIRDLEAEVDRHQRAMDRELAALQDKKLYASNSLAGATWEQSISTEMRAVTDKYSTKMRIAQERIASLRRRSEELAKRQQQ